MSDRLLETMASMPNICRAIHLPAQSAPRLRMLCRMNRKYDRECRACRIAAIRRYMRPDYAPSIRHDRPGSRFSRARRRRSTKRRSRWMRESMGMSAFMFNNTGAPKHFRPAPYARRRPPTRVKSARLTEHHRPPGRTPRWRATAATRRDDSKCSLRVGVAQARRPARGPQPQNKASSVFDRRVSGGRPATTCGCTSPAARPRHLI